MYLFIMHNKDARYTWKVPLYIKFQTVRYHNFAQFGISYTAVAKCTCRKQCFPICHATGKCDKRTSQWIKLSEHPKWINKRNSRSEIWHYFWYKTGDKGEWTDRTEPLCKHYYRPKSCCLTSNLFKHLSLAQTDFFRELRDRQVSASFINSDLIWTFIYNWSMHIQMWCSKLKRACETR